MCRAEARIKEHFNYKILLSALTTRQYWVYPLHYFVNKDRYGSQNKRPNHLKDED